MTNISIYLPPVNEVWDRVMFSQACVSHSVLGCHFLSGCLVPLVPDRDLPPQTEALSDRDPPDRDLRMVKSGRYTSLLECFHVQFILTTTTHDNTPIKGKIENINKTSSWQKLRSFLLCFPKNSIEQFMHATKVIKQH